MTFRKFQSIVDLRKAAISLLEGSPTVSQALGARLLEQLGCSFSPRIPVWKLDLSAEMLLEIHLRATSPDDGQTQFLAATCLLLLDRFERPERGSDFQWEWDAFAPAYRDANRTIRAAIMNGLDQARKCSIVSGDVRPNFADFIRIPKDEVVLPLIQLAKSLTAEEREWIAKADRGEDVELHLAALNHVLESKACRYPVGEVWYPAEVVELVSFGKDNPGFVGCTALMLINAIADKDGKSHAEFRWASLRHYYDSLEPDEKTIIHGGFRYIYEANRNWDPYWKKFAPERLPTDGFIRF